MNPVESFRQSMAASGVVWNGEILADGRLHRIHVDGDKSGTKNGWYNLRLDPVPFGAFGCWKRGVSEQWRGKDAKALTEDERRAMQSLIDEERRRRDEEHRRAATLAEETWSKAEPANPQNEYLARKQVDPCGLKQLGEALIVPLRDIDGKIWSIQHIYPSGEKWFIQGGRIGGCFFTFGELPDGEDGDAKIIVCEGFSTGATIYKAMKCVVVAAMSAGNLATVSRAIRANYPQANILLAADNDAFTGSRNPGVESATAAANTVRGGLIVPDFSKCDMKTKPTDFNDLARLAGMDAVSHQIRAASEVKTMQPPAEATLERLAKMPPFEYEQCRKDHASSLGMRVSKLDEAVQRLRQPTTEIGQGSLLRFDPPSPWPEPVDGCQLLSELSSIYRDHVILPNGAAEVLGAWTILTYVFDVFEYTPLIFVTAPERECGKSLVRDLALKLVCRPLSTDCASSPFLFRTIEIHRPTLFLDEFDNVDLKTRTDLIAIINGGYHRAGSVGRIVGESHEPRLFTTYCPKMLVSIGNTLPDATRSRAVTITMRRKLPRESIRSHRGVDFIEIQQKCVRWASDNKPNLLNAHPSPILELSDRQKDVTEPLLAIADLVGSGWGQRIRDAVSATFETPDMGSQNLGTELLADIAVALADKDRISTSDLLSALHAMDERPWRHHGKGGLNARTISQILRPYSIESRSVRLPDGKTPKGFHRSQFEDAFIRYLPSNNPPQRHNATTPESIDDSENAGCATGDSCGGVNNPYLNSEYRPCGGVAQFAFAGPAAEIKEGEL